MFKKAERRKAYLKLAITGPSGAGKTYSALTIASGMSKRIALVDSENESSSLYAAQFDFDSVNVKPPYTVEKYQSAIRMAVQEGYEVLIIDSLTHVWNGTGGLLEQKEVMDRRPGSNSFTNWSHISKLHRALIAEFLHSDIHLICTMRSKQDYILVEKNGKQVPRKVGMAPEQREGMEYEFTTVFDLAMDHSAEVSKDRTGLFDSKIFTPTAETGTHLMEWLKSGKDIEKEIAVTAPTQSDFAESPSIENDIAADFAQANTPAPVFRGPSSAQLNRLEKILHEARWPNEELKKLLLKLKKDNATQLNNDEYNKVCNFIKANPIKGSPAH